MKNEFVKKIGDHYYYFINKKRSKQKFASRSKANLERNTFIYQNDIKIKNKEFKLDRITGNQNNQVNWS